jgi:hypothetical protein
MVEHASWIGHWFKAYNAFLGYLFTNKNFAFPVDTIIESSLTIIRKKKKNICFQKMEYKIRPVSLVGMKILPHFFIIKLVPWSETTLCGMPCGR